MGDHGKTLEDAVADALEGHKSVVVCPSHDDSTPSLSVAPGKDHPVLLHCHAGCEPDKIIADGGLDWAVIMAPEDPDKGAVNTGLWTPVGAASKVYPYIDAKGTLLYEVLRIDKPDGKKRIMQRQPDATAKGGYAWNLDGVERVLYRLPAVLEAVREGRTIHVCFSPDTEVLTEEGWVILPELSSRARVAQYDKATGEVSFALPSARQILPFEGELVHFETRFSDTLVTPDHRMLRKSRLDLDPAVIPAYEVRAQSYLPVSGVKTWNRNGMRPYVSANDARLVAAWQADGTDLPSKWTCGWNAKKVRKITRLAEVLDACGVPWKRQSFDSAPGWTWTKADRTHWALTSEWKNLDWSMLNWSVEAREAFIEELANWDGDRTGDRGIRFFTANPRVAEIVSAVAVISGYGCITRVDVREDRPEQGPQYILNINRREWRRMQDSPKRVPYSGLVYCLTVPTGFLVTRRNGKTTVAGNCEGEKCAEALQRVIAGGEQATCNPMGAGRWEDHYGEMLSGAHVIIYADADDPGRTHARMVRENLLEHGCTVTVKEAPPGVLRDGKSINDVADHLEAGHPLETLLETTPEAERERSRTGIDILDLIGRPRGQTEFVIPHTLARGERMILIGFEGTGKSTLCRQIAAQVAGGIHPFDGRRVEPQRVLYIDAENHPDQVDENWSSLVGLMARKERPIERGQLIVMEEWESNIDLASPEGAMWLTERVHAYQPALVVMGPLTNLAGKDLRDDEPVRRMRNAVNAARSVCNSAFIMEHHAPHKGPMDKERQVRPYGSSLFLKWPDYGYGMKPMEQAGVFEWIKNRGPRVRSRLWPGWIREGLPGTDEFPWETCILDENGQIVR